MILHTTFMYLAEVCAPRRRTYEPRLFSARLAVEVAETGLDALPVAFRFDDPDAHPHPDMGHEVRWDGENLWEAHETVEYGGLTSQASRDRRDLPWLMTRIDHRDVPTSGLGQDPLRLRIPGARSRDGAYPFIEADPAVARVRSSTHDARRAEVVAAASALLVADGLLLRRAHEPVHQLKWGGPLHAKHRRVQVIQPSRHDGNDGDAWRADEVARMVAENRMDPAYAAALVEVLIPEACRAPLAESALATAGSMAASALHDVSQRDAGVAAVQAPLLREARAVFAAVKAGLPIDAAPLAGALGEARPLLDRLGPEREYVVAMVDVALRRYDDVGLSADLGFALP